MYRISLAHTQAHACVYMFHQSHILCTLCIPFVCLSCCLAFCQLCFTPLLEADPCGSVQLLDSTVQTGFPSAVAAVTSEPDGRSRSLPRAAFRMPCVPAAMPISAQSAAAAFVLPSSPCFCVSGASAASVAHHASSALDVHQSCLRWGLERLVAEAVALYRGVQDMLNGFDILRTGMADLRWQPAQRRGKPWMAPSETKDKIGKRLSQRRHGARLRLLTISHHEEDKVLNGAFSF